MKLRGNRPSGPMLCGLAVILGLPGLAAPGHAQPPAPPVPATGPAADYPMVLGAPFTIDGVTYTPADKLNLDEVGYAVIDPAAGPGISIAHRTLPLPSYAEVTSLRTGRTILVRVERRGPAGGSAAVALSLGAAAQLGAGDARTPIRIRRVNPPEPERALLRAGQPAPARMDTPMSLVAVLLRKLDPNAPVVPPQSAAPTATAAAAVAKPAITAAPAPTPTPKKPAVMPPLQVAVRQEPPAAPPPVARPAAKPAIKPAATARPAPVPVASAAAPAPVRAATGGGTVVQVGAYANRASAEKVAARVGGTVSPAGKLFRVRIGGLATAQAAAAALAKAKAAGYSEARIQHAD